MQMEEGLATEITRKSDGKRMYTGVWSVNHSVAAQRPDEFSVKIVRFKGCCIASNINDRAHDRTDFQIRINGFFTKEFIDEIATEEECRTFFA